MKLLLVGGPANGEIVDVPDSDSAIKWVSENRSGGIHLYNLKRWGFGGVGWFYIGVHSKLSADDEAKLAVQGMLRPELLDQLHMIGR